MNDRTLARTIAQAAFDKKGEQIVLLDLTKLSAITRYFVIISGHSTIQTQAIANQIEERLEKKKIRPYSTEGRQHGHWILLDYGDVVAHIFYDEAREFYALEKLWSDAIRVPLRLK